MNDGHIKLRNDEIKVSQFIPDYIQKSISEQMDKIDNEIRAHEERIRELSDLYTAHARFLERYSPFEQGNLSQCCSDNIANGSGAMPQSREEGLMRKMSKQKHNHNATVDAILYAADHGRIKHDLSPAYTRPLYYGTSQQIGGHRLEKGKDGADKDGGSGDSEGADQDHNAGI